MRGTRVAPTVELNASIDKHLEAAGVSQPVDVAHRISEQEYETWHEVVLLNPHELKELTDLVGLKHKSATKLARYIEDYRRYNQSELTAEVRPSEPLSKSKEVQSIAPVATTTEEHELQDSPKTTGSLLTVENDNISSSSANIAISAAPANIVIPDSSASVVGSVTCDELIGKATAAAQDRSDFAAAVELFREAIDLNPKSDAAWFGLGYSLYQRDGGNTEEQITCYERTIELNPKHAMARSNLGNQLLTLRKDFKSAEYQFRTAISLDSTCADAHNHLGWLLQNSKGEAGADEAESQFRAAIALDPSYTDAHVNLGWLMQNIRKDYSAAEVCYRDAIELDPNNVQATYNLGLLLDGRGEDVGGAKAEERYRRAIELDPKNVLALISLGRLLEKSDTKGAEKCYRNAIDIDPMNASAHNCLGVVLEIGTPVRVDEAEAHYRRAVELDPSHSSASYNLGLLLEVVRRDYDGAEACYRKTIAIDPSNANAHSNLGILLKDIRKDYDAAEKCYRRAIEVDPQHSAACNNLGTLLETVRDDLKGAEEMYRRAMSLDITNADAVLNLGILLHGKAEKVEMQLKEECPNLDPALLTSESIQLALNAANLYCEAAGLWDLSDGEGNKYSAASRLSASQLKALCSISSNPNTPVLKERTSSGSFLHSANISPIIRHSRPTSARSRPSSAHNHRPSSAHTSKPPSSSASSTHSRNSGERANYPSTGFTGIVNDNPQLYQNQNLFNVEQRSSSMYSQTNNTPSHLTPHISPQDAAIVSGIGVSAQGIGDPSAHSAAARPWAAAAEAAERAAKELAAVAVKLESYSSDDVTSQNNGASASSQQQQQEIQEKQEFQNSSSLNKKSSGDVFASIVGTSNKVLKAVDQLEEVSTANMLPLEGFKLDANNFNDEDEDGLEELFRIVDRNGDGGVTRLELKKALNHKGEEGAILRAKLCKTLGVPAAVTDRKARDVFENVFDCIDADGGASLDLQEMKKFVKDMKRVASIYEKSQKPDYDARKNTEVDPRIVRLLELSDINRDGKLSHAEIIRSMKYHPNIRKYLNNEPVEDD